MNDQIEQSQQAFKQWMSAQPKKPDPEARKRRDFLWLLAGLVLGTIVRIGYEAIQGTMVSLDTVGTAFVAGLAALFIWRDPLVWLDNVPAGGKFLIGLLLGFSSQTAIALLTENKVEGVLVTGGVSWLLKR